MAVNFTEFKDAYNRRNVEEWFSQQSDEAVHAMVGGWARLKVLVLLACVLAMDSADKATVGAIAVPLEHSLHIGNLDIGLLVTASTGIGALATLPMGILADRINRVKLLAVSIFLWSAVMAVSGVANSFIMLLVTRLALGAVIATVMPVIASLTGDYFSPGVRGRIWGYILSGELLGAGLGILISGEIAAVASWHFSFWVLSMVGFLLTLAIWKWLPEPPRGSHRFLPKDKEEIPSTEELQEDSESTQETNGEANGDEDKVEEKIEEGNIAPHEEQILDKSPEDMSFWHAARYILSIRTNVLLIIASAGGYFFFTGLRTFIMVYTQGQFHLSMSTSQLVVVLIGLGAIIGVLITGRTADDLIERGYISARITVGGFAYLITAIAFLAGFYMKSLLVAMPLFFIGATSLGGVNAPIDAARLDIMNARLWGRAESIRTAFRFTFEALAPIIFGWVSMLLGGQSGFFGGSSGNGATALAQTFKIMLLPLIIAIIVLYWARKTYPRDVATVLASEEDSD